MDWVPQGVQLVLVSYAVPLSRAHDPRLRHTSKLTCNCVLHNACVGSELCLYVLRHPAWAVAGRAL